MARRRSCMGEKSGCFDRLRVQFGGKYKVYHLCTLYKWNCLFTFYIARFLQKRLEQTLEVLKRAPIPWSSTINTLAETSSNFQHSLSSKIKIECDYVPIKLVLKKYGYATIGVNSVSTSGTIVTPSETSLWITTWTNLFVLETNITHRKRRSWFHDRWYGCAG